MNELWPENESQRSEQNKLGVTDNQVDIYKNNIIIIIIIESLIPHQKNTTKMPGIRTTGYETTSSKPVKI